MSRWIALAICGLVLVSWTSPGCFGETTSSTTSSRPASTQPAAATQPAKPLVKYHYLNAIIVCDWTITINADGTLHSVEDPSFGRVRDPDGKTEIREGRLTPAQLDKLTKVLKHAASLPKPKPCETLDAAVLLDFGDQGFQALGDSRFDEARKMIVDLAESFPARTVDPPKDK
jgi:hypothetical protein